MNYRTNSVRTIRTVRAIRGETLVIDLGRPIAEGRILRAWMKREPDDLEYRSFEIKDNRYLVLSKDKASDYIEDGEVVSPIVGKWYFDVESRGVTPDDVETVYQGIIQFQADITGSQGAETPAPTDGRYNTEQIRLKDPKAESIYGNDLDSQSDVNKENVKYHEAIKNSLKSWYHQTSFIYDAYSRLSGKVDTVSQELITGNPAKVLLDASINTSKEMISAPIGFKSEKIGLPYNGGRYSIKVNINATISAAGSFVPNPKDPKKFPANKVSDLSVMLSDADNVIETKQLPIFGEGIYDFTYFSEVKLTGTDEVSLSINTTAGIVHINSIDVEVVAMLPLNLLTSMNPLSQGTKVWSLVVGDNGSLNIVENDDNGAVKSVHMEILENGDISAKGANLKDLKNGVEEQDAVTMVQLQAVEDEMDNIEKSVGLQDDGGIIPFTGTHYLDGSPTFKSALERLDSTSYITRTPWNRDGNNIYFSQGNVGIGAEPTTDKLHVEGDAAVSGIMKVDTIEGLSRNFVLLHGSLGINVLAPSDKIHINGGIRVAGTSYARLTDKAFESYKGGTYYIDKFGIDGSLAIRTGVNGTQKTRIFIANDGRIGFNTANPEAMIHINEGDINVRGFNSKRHIRFTESNYRGAYIAYDGDNVRKFQIGVHSDDDKDPSKDTPVLEISRDDAELVLLRPIQFQDDDMKLSRNGYSLLLQQKLGNLQIGVRDSQYAAFYTDRNNFVFNKTIQVAGGLMNLNGSDHDITGFRDLIVRRNIEALLVKGEVLQYNGEDTDTRYLKTSDIPLSNVVTVNGVQTILGLKTFNDLVILNAPTKDNQAANKLYVDTTILDAISGETHKFHTTAEFNTYMRTQPYPEIGVSDKVVIVSDSDPNHGLWFATDKQIGSSTYDLGVAIQAGDFTLFSSDTGIGEAPNGDTAYARYKEGWISDPNFAALSIGGKNINTIFAPITHYHAISDINSLQNVLDSKLSEKDSDALYRRLDAQVPFNQVAGLLGSGDGSKFLSDDGTYRNPTEKFYWEQVGDAIHNLNRGNVGVGLANPATKLHIDGVLRVDNTSGLMMSLRDKSNSLSYHVLNTQGRLGFSNNDDVEKVSISQGGSVSIGTTSENNSKFTVAGSLNSIIAKLGRTADNRYTIFDNGVGLRAVYWHDGTRFVKTRYGHDQLDKSVTVTGDGRLSIGMEPDINVALTSNGIGRFIKSGSNVQLKDTKIGQLAVPTLDFIDGNNSKLGVVGYVSPNTKDLSINNNQDGGDITFSTRSLVSSTVMTIKDDGNVGIGTVNPRAKLEVSGDTFIGGDLSIRDYFKFVGNLSNIPTAETACYIGWGNSPLLAGEMVLVPRTSIEAGLSIYNKLGNDTVRAMRVRYGNVGIGTEPLKGGDKLSVSGSAKFTGKITIDGGMDLVANKDNPLVIKRNTFSGVGDDITTIYQDDAGITFTVDNDRDGDVVKYAFNHTVEGKAKLLFHISGTKVSSYNPLFVYGGLTVAGQLVGGIGAGTGNTHDWNDVSNSKSGNGNTLLNGTDTNGMGGAAKYHAFNFEYGETKNGSGTTTQLAIPYDLTHPDAGFLMRSRYTGNWSNWCRVIAENTKGNVGIGTLTPESKLHVVGSVISSKGDEKIALTYFGINATRHTAYFNNLSKDGSIKFQTISNDESSLSSKLVILGNGNVGIGVENPTMKLEVDGAIKGSTIFGSSFYSNPTDDLNVVGSLDGGLIVQRYSGGAKNKPFDSNNANAVLTIHSHPGGYGKQLAFGDSDDLYIRRFTSGSFGGWRKLYHKGNSNNSSALWEAGFMRVHDQLMLRGTSTNERLEMWGSQPYLSFYNEETDKRAGYIQSHSGNMLLNVEGTSDGIHFRVSDVLQAYVSNAGLNLPDGNVLQAYDKGGTSWNNYDARYTATIGALDVRLKNDASASWIWSVRGSTSTFKAGFQISNNSEYSHFRMSNNIRISAWDEELLFNIDGYQVMSVDKLGTIKSDSFYTGKLTNLNDGPTGKDGGLSVYNYERGATNSPTTQNNDANAVLHIQSHHSNYGKQLAFVDNDDLYLRKFNAGSYGTWYKFLHTGNSNKSTSNWSMYTANINHKAVLKGSNENERIQLWGRIPYLSFYDVDDNKRKAYIQSYARNLFLNSDEGTIEFRAKNEKRVEVNEWGMLAVNGNTYRSYDVTGTTWGNYSYANKSTQGAFDVRTLNNNEASWVWTVRGADNAFKAGFQTRNNAASSRLYFTTKGPRNFTAIQANSIGFGFYLADGGDTNGKVFEIDQDGTCTANDFISTSDIRLKDNIVTITDALTKVNQLRGVTYQRKDIESDRQHIGLIAQEVEKVFPELVKENSEGFKAVNYAQITAVLIEAIKELKDKLDEVPR